MNKKTVTSPNEKLWEECEAAADTLLQPQTKTINVRALYDFAIDQRQISTNANIDQASRAYERGKRDGSKQCK